MATTGGQLVLRAVVVGLVFWMAASMLAMLVGSMGVVELRAIFLLSIAVGVVVFLLRDRQTQDSI